MTSFGPISGLFGASGNQKVTLKKLVVVDTTHDPFSGLLTTTSGLQREPTTQEKMRLSEFTINFDEKFGTDFLSSFSCVSFSGGG